MFLFETRGNYAALVASGQERHKEEIQSVHACRHFFGTGEIILAPKRKNIGHTLLLLTIFKVKSQQQSDWASSMTPALK